VKVTNVQWTIGAITFLRDADGTRANITLMPPVAFQPEPILLTAGPIAQAFSGGMGAAAMAGATQRPVRSSRAARSDRPGRAAAVSPALSGRVIFQMQAPAPRHSVKCSAVLITDARRHKNADFMRLSREALAIFLSQKNGLSRWANYVGRTFNGQPIRQTQNPNFYGHFVPPYSAVSGYDRASMMPN